MHPSLVKSAKGAVALHVVAPGDQLVSVGVPGNTLYDDYPSLRVKGALGGAYLRLSGTSMATAVATGVVALAVELETGEPEPCGDGLSRVTDPVGLISNVGVALGFAATGAR